MKRIRPPRAARPSGRRNVALQVAAVLVAAASAVSGSLGLARDLRIAFRDAWPSVFPGQFQRQVKTVEETVPPGAVFFHIADASKDPGTGWYSRLWQRALYPRNLVIVLLNDLRPEHLEELRKRYRVRYAISVGTPPIDPGFRWHRELGSVPGSHQTWFGELRP